MFLCCPVWAPVRQAAVVVLSLKPLLFFPQETDTPPEVLTTGYDNCEVILGTLGSHSVLREPQRRK